MPTDWTYHANGVQTGVQTTHRLDGELKQVDIQIDCFRTRQWTEEEVENASVKPGNLHWDDENEVHEQHKDGSHALLRFAVSDGMAELSKIIPKDDDYLAPRHMMLLRAADRLLAQLSDVEDFESPVETLLSMYDDTAAAGIHIDRLDG